MKLKQPDIKGLSKIKNSETLAKPTPMMAQYLEVKERHKEYLLFYRMGDFYELFFDDAKIAASSLGIALTKRGKANGVDIPMCGVPVHSSQTYLSRLIKSGFKVAIAEQLEESEQDLKKNQKIFKRDVVRIITPGTILEESLLESKNHNNLLSLNFKKGDISLAWIDMTNGEIKLQRVKGVNILQDLQEVIHKVEPGEIIVSEVLKNSELLKGKLKIFEKNISIIPNSFYDLKNNEIKIKTFFKKSKIESLGDFTEVDISTIGALLNYLELTQKKNIPNIKSLEIVDQDNFMQIDMFSQKSLELFQSYDGQRKGSLIHIIDNTKTASGARLLRDFLKSPLLQKNEIKERHDLIESFIFKNESLKKIIKLLTGLPDVERTISRISAKTNNPKDLIMICNFIVTSEEIFSEIEKSKNKTLLKLFPENDLLKNVMNVKKLIEKKIVESPPINLSEGGVIKSDVSQKLDDLRNIKRKGKNQILALQEKYIFETKVNNLKIKFNNIHGYFIEVSIKNSTKLHESERISFNPIQNTLNSSRFQTDELKSISLEIENSEMESIKLESIIYSEIIEEILKFSEEISSISKVISYIDVMTNFSDLSQKRNYSRPELSNETIINVSRGRHPVVEDSLKKDGIEFTPNDSLLTKKDNIWLMTGPNMAGKSTFLRQTALLVILNQIGCYVPAEIAKIGIFDKIFTRIGASDNLSLGMSTFMMEMVETSRILDQATNSSLVILDELGRGTASEDGLAIAYSVLEYICTKIKCITLFATHYKELCKMKEKFKQIKNKTLQIKKWEEEVIFHYKIIDGISEGSFGIHVANLAGINKKIIARAKDILINLNNKKSVEIQENNFRESDSKKSDNENNKLIEEIKKLDLDNLSPKDSLDILYTLKKNYLKNK